MKADNFAQDDSNDNMLFISDNNKKDKSMTLKLDEVRILEASALNDEQKEFIKANEAELSQDEKVKFGLVAPAPAPTPSAPETFSAEDRQILADITSGAKVLMTKEEVLALTQKVDASAESVKAMKRKEIEADITEKGIKTGRIVADQLTKWADLVEADASNLDILLAIPENKVVVDAAIGAEGGEAKDKQEQIHAAAVKIQADAREAGKTVPSYTDARHKAEAELNKEENK